MDILACTDENYIMPCGVMMCSVCENNKKEQITFHLLVDQNVTQVHQKELLDIANTYRCKIYFYYFDNIKLQHLPIGGHLTLTTYYRLFIEDLLPNNINRVLYLDCDVIVRSSLHELFEMNIDNISIAAIPDLSEGMIERYSRLKYSKELGYFNAGVLLINLDYWRQHKLKKAFEEYITNNITKLAQHDQDVLNYVCKDSKTRLPLMYNVQDGFLYNRTYFDVNKYKEELDIAMVKPVILHFTSRKPWEEGCIHPYRDEFFKYQALTQYKNMPLMKASNNYTIKQQIVRFLRFIHVIKPRYRKRVKHLQ